MFVYIYLIWIPCVPSNHIQNVRQRGTKEECLCAFSANVCIYFPILAKECASVFACRKELFEIKMFAYKISDATIQSSSIAKRFQSKHTRTLPNMNSTHAFYIRSKNNTCPAHWLHMSVCARACPLRSRFLISNFNVCLCVNMIPTLVSKRAAILHFKLTKATNNSARKQKRVHERFQLLNNLNTMLK